MTLVKILVQALETSTFSPTATGGQHSSMALDVFYFSADSHTTICSPEILPSEIFCMQE